MSTGEDLQESGDALIKVGLGLIGAVVVVAMAGWVGLAGVLLVIFLIAGGEE